MQACIIADFSLIQWEVEIQSEQDPLAGETPLINRGAETPRGGPPTLSALQPPSAEAAAALNYITGGITRFSLNVKHQL